MQKSGFPKMHHYVGFCKSGHIWVLVVLVTPVKDLSKKVGNLSSYLVNNQRLARL